MTAAKFKPFAACNSSSFLSLLDTTEMDQQAVA
jgi:hypothetical protein